MQQYPDYDQTVVGECGAVVGGGQRARVSLSGELYADGDFYFLDDSLLFPRNRSAPVYMSVRLVTEVPEFMVNLN